MCGVVIGRSQISSTSEGLEPSMKLVVTGGAGSVSKPLAQRLLTQGHDVTVVGRSPGNLADLVGAGAQQAIGDLEDVGFLTSTFAGADGVYLMLPGNGSADSVKDFSVKLAEGFVAALTGSSVSRVVFLSSCAAHRLDGAGPLSGLGLAESVLAALTDTSLLALRAGYFYTNLLQSVDQLRATGTLGNMFDIPAGTLPIVDPDDIANVAAKALTTDEYAGRTYVYVASDETGTDEIAALIGREIGQPHLRWSRLPSDDVAAVFRSFGFAESAVQDYLEGFVALDEGVLYEEYATDRPQLGTTKIEDFAKTFAAAYDGS
jgi:uncharacterized protein YbjT (DUF2867 family)